jgi:CDP-diacylglycerol--glycerol-3-phosphate 3-phosphatidyltransferase
MIYDIAADFMVVFSIFLLWYIQKKVAIYILFLLLFCFYKLFFRKRRIFK